MSGGSAMPEEVMRNFEKAFGCKVLEGYGLSETSPVASFNHPDKPNKAGSIGTPIQGVEMKLADDDGNEVGEGEVGEILIKGHNVMKGYYNREEATAEAIRDGWFATGDMGKVDEDGYYFIVDRKKELIIRGGYNVYPREVEEVLYAHPAVSEVAVIGIPDDRLGEEVRAVIALKSGQSLDEAEAIAYEQWRSNVFAPPVCWDLELTDHFDAVSADLPMERVAATVDISADLDRHAANLRSYAEIGFDRIYLHHVGQEQAAFIDAFGAKVLPQLA